MYRNSMRENRETPPAPEPRPGRAGWRKAMSHKSNKHAGGESYNPIVPAKRPNKDDRESAEGVEGRGWTKENTGESNTDRIQSRVAVSQGLVGVRQAFAASIQGRNRVR